MSEKRRRFAEGTEVPVERSRQELEAVLDKHGAEQIAVYTDRKQKTGRIVFKLAGRMVRLDVHVTAPTELPRGYQWKTDSEQNAWRGRQLEQAEREGWRRLLLIVKAKLELIADAGTSPEAIEREFLADIMLPDGATVYESMAAGIEDAYKLGTMPSLMLPAARTPGARRMRGPD